MSRYSGEGSCESCQEKFRYFLLDTNINASRYGYCSVCGTTALAKTGSEVYGAIDDEDEARLDACSCGGRFRGDAAPRCPFCHEELSARTAGTWIEGNLAKKRPDWRWQGSWHGLYCIVIENRLVTDG